VPPGADLEYELELIEFSAVDEVRAAAVEAALLPERSQGACSCCTPW